MTKRQARIEALKIAHALIHRNIYQGGMELEDQKIFEELDKILDGLKRRADRLKDVK